MKGQVLLRLSISEKTNELLKKRANLLGVTLTQFARHIIIQELHRLESSNDKDSYKLSNPSDFKTERAELERLVSIVNRVRLRLAFQDEMKKKKYNF